MSAQNNQEEIKEPVETETVQRAVAVTPYYSYILVACIVLVFIVQIATDPPGSVVLGGIRSALIAGLNRDAFLNFGEYWRIITSATVHLGVIHLAFNGYALYILGKLIETLSNKAHLAIVFLLSVIGSGVLSLTFSPDINSLGASGGIIGFLGYLTVYGYYRRKLLSNAFLKNMLFNIGLIAVIGVIVFPTLNTSVSENIPRVDNFGHLGGLLTGIIYGIFQIPRDLYKDPREVSGFTETLGMVALAIFIFFSVLSIFLILGWIRL